MAVRAAVAAWSRFTGEDFLITLRYAENLAAGHGFVFNPGERVFGSTTPLYTLVLALFAWLNMPAAFLGKALNVLADGALCIVVYRWLAAAGNERAGRLAALFVAANPLQIQWSISGMETGLVTLGGMLVWLFHSERRERAMLAAGGVLFLLRWDSLLLTAVATASLALRERRAPRLGVAIFGAIVAPWLVFATWYFGSPVPVTALAKSTVYGWRADLSPSVWHRLFPSLPVLAHRVVGTPGYALVAACAFAGFWLLRREPGSAIKPAVVWFALYWAAFLASRNLLFPWYLVPPSPVYLALAAIGQVAMWRRWVEWESGRVGEGEKRRIGVLSLSPSPALPLLSVLVVAAGGTFAGISARREQEVEERVRIPMALYLRDAARPSDRVMLEPIGYVGYYSRLPVLDVVGLVSLEVLSCYRHGVQAPMQEMADRYRPRWCILRPGELARIERGAAAQNRRWEDDYCLERTYQMAPGRDVYFIFRRR